MSGPYDQYNQGYGSQYPQGGYSQQPQYGEGYQQQYPPQQQQGGYPPQEFAPPRRQDSFGPPSHGGFQHGQVGHQYGQYDASNPQGHSNYYGGYPQQQPHQQQNYGGNDAYAQNQAYQHSMSSGQPQSQYPGTTPSDPNAANHQFQPQSSDPNAPNYDPKAPPMTEGDRGLLGALGGGFGGHHFGKKQGHGFLGTIGGALVGSIAEDFLKDKKKNKHHSSGGSSWGGSKW